MIVKWHGVGGRTVAKVLKHNLHVVKEFAPNIIILQLGTNDLAPQPAETVGSMLEELARILHVHYSTELTKLHKIVSAK